MTTLITQAVLRSGGFAVLSSVNSFGIQRWIREKPNREIQKSALAVLTITFISTLIQEAACPIIDTKSTMDGGSMNKILTDVVMFGLIKPFAIVSGIQVVKISRICETKNLPTNTSLYFESNVVSSVFAYVIFGYFSF